MERLRRTVIQLEGARRFILDGEVARLRLALILLDNAVEVMLHGRVQRGPGDAAHLLGPATVGRLPRILLFEERQAPELAHP